MNPSGCADFYPDLLRRILDLSSNVAYKTFVVAITGPDCAGKSTATRWLLDNLSEQNIKCSALAADSYIRPREQRTGLPNEAEDYYRNGFNFDHLLRDLNTLKRQIDADLPDQNHIIIVEGVFLLKSDISQYWDAAFWLDISDDQILERGTRRDADFFGSREKAAEIYESQIIPAQHLHRTLDNPESKADRVYIGRRARLND
jgi:uridine kinase